MSLSNSQSFFEPPPSDSDDEVNSLPSSTTGSSVDDDEYVSDAEREWRESLQQIELLLTMVLVPYVGKYFGRKAAYWGECTELEAGEAPSLVQIHPHHLDVQSGRTSWLTISGWAKFMTWKYPVEIVITSPTAFKAAGAVEAAASI